MIGVSEKEFELLNALADGELSGLEKEELLQRIENDDAFKHAYDRINSIKEKVVLIHNLPIDDAVIQPIKAKPRYGRYLAMAASVACVMFASSFYYSFEQSISGAPTTAIAWHEKFSDKQYVVNEEHGPLFMSVSMNSDVAIPDLSPSRLYLVEHIFFNDKEDGQAAALHYRGFNGCRLTVWVGANGINIPKPAKALSDANMHYSWLVGTLEYRILATGMDKNRFQSVANYMEATTRLEEEKKKTNELLMASVYEKAVPCS